MQVKSANGSTKYENHDSGCTLPGTRWRTTVLDRLLPPRCVLCGCSVNAMCLCESCWLDLPWTGPHCRQCGLPLTCTRDEICGRCLRMPPPFYCTASPLQYLFPVSRLVQAFKFQRQLAAGRVLGQLLCNWVEMKGYTLPDALVPVALHHRRLYQRGFNQAYELAVITARALGVPIMASGLRRGRNTVAQSGLSRSQRRKNMRGAFSWQGRNKVPGHVALIDDVMTTGTTVTKCTRALKHAGARRVDVWVAARTIATPHH